MDEENRKKNKPIAKVEESNRQVGLSEPICEDNKGFEMLKKMGFEPGKGLGKSGEKYFSSCIKITLHFRHFVI